MLHLGRKRNDVLWCCALNVVDMSAAVHVLTHVLVDSTVHVPLYPMYRTNTIVDLLVRLPLSSLVPATCICKKGEPRVTTNDVHVQLYPGY